MTYPGDLTLSDLGLIFSHLRKNPCIGVPKTAARKGLSIGHPSGRKLLSQVNYKKAFLIVYRCFWLRVILLL